MHRDKTQGSKTNLRHSSTLIKNEEIRGYAAKQSKCVTFNSTMYWVQSFNVCQVSCIKQIKQKTALIAHKNKITLVGILQVFQAVSCSLNGWFMARISCDMDLISKFCLHKTNVKLIYLEEQVELNNLRLISCTHFMQRCTWIQTEQAQGQDQNERFWNVNPVCLSECQLPWSHWGHCRQSFVLFLLVLHDGIKLHLRALIPILATHLFPKPFPFASRIHLHLTLV